MSVMRDFGSSAPASQSKLWQSYHENDGLPRYGGGRDMIGYGGTTPAVKWPKHAKLALSIVVDYHEGGEGCLLHGDAEGGKRYVTVESMYDYGARAGFWRWHRLFTKRKVPVTVFAVGMALERNPVVCQALKERSDWEVASHGYRLIDYSEVEEEMEREHIARSIKIHERLLGKRPSGIYVEKPSVNTRKLIIEEGGFKYDSDNYSEDLPFWTLDYGDKPHLIIPYTKTENDMQYDFVDAFPTGAQFANHLKDTLKHAVDEGKAGRPIMMTIALHCRLARPGRVAALADFLDFVKSHHERDVWFCTREQVAEFWAEHHYPKGAGSPVQPDRGSRAGGIGGMPAAEAANNRGDGDFI